MKTDRRKFLKATGLATIAAATTTPAMAQTATATMGVNAGQPNLSQPNLNQPLPKNMTLATIERNGKLALGIRTPSGILDVAAAEAEFKTGAPVVMEDLIARKGDVSGLQKLADRAKAGEAAKYLIAEGAAKFGPLVSSAAKILCIGLNYRAHVAEANQTIPKSPIFFNKFNSSLNSHNGTVSVTTESAKNFDYEAELVLIMAKGGRNISEADALSCVFGYAVGQDISARDLQSSSSQWMMGKAGDGWGPIGPWLVTADQIDPQALDIECSVNGEKRQSSNTKMMIFNVAQQIAFLSKHLTLSPGDVIFTGTPEGVIAGYPKDKQVWLKPGDKLVTKIDKLGEQVVTFT